VHLQSNTETEVLEEKVPLPKQPAMPLWTRKALLRSVFREDRFFLVLSVFIGVFSGLSVVCFRFAIDWARIYLLGTGAVLSTSRLLLAPSLAGLVIAFLVIHFFPATRGSGRADKSAMAAANRFRSPPSSERSSNAGVSPPAARSARVSPARSSGRQDAAIVQIA